MVDMVRKILLIAAISLLVTTLAPLVPSATAHQDGCQLAAHFGTTQTHLACTTNANTCFMNVQHANTEANVVCVAPEPQPCVVKVRTFDNRVVACTNHVGPTDD